MVASRQKGWQITAIGTCINLCNVLFVWSVLKREIKGRMDAGDPDWDWGGSLLNVPFSVGMLAFPCSAFPAGCCYDKFGPRIVTSVGGALVALGLLLCSYSTSLYAWTLGFGVCMSCGLGACYSVQTPTAVKWFPASRTGLVAGIVVSGFGLSPLLLAPLASALVASSGPLAAMRHLAVIFFAIIVPLAQFLENPPSPAQGPKQIALQHDPGSADFTLGEAVRTRALWLCWVLIAIGGGCGNMMVGEGALIGEEALGESAWIALAVKSVGNFFGRIVAGVMHDKIGLRMSLLFFFTFQAVMMLALVLIPKDSVVCILAVAALVGLNHGAHPCLWPVAARSFFGTAAFGAIHGVILTGLGLGSFALSTAFQVAKERTGSINAFVLVTFLLLLVGDGLILLMEPPVKPTRDISLELHGKA